eukprot:3103300-Pyramimonas_sp.AAC.1
MWRLKQLSAPICGPLHAPQPHVIDRRRGRCVRSTCPCIVGGLRYQWHGRIHSKCPAGMVASVTRPALADDAGCPAGVVAGAAALFIIIAVT